MVNNLVGRRAVIAKLGMDAHWRGAIVVANALRQAGMEVLYLGHTTPAALAAAVVEEDPALVGLSTLSGNHLVEVPAVLAAMAALGIDDVPVVVGGAVGPQDATSLLAAGVAAVFPTGQSLTLLLAELDEILGRAADSRASR